MKCWELVHKLMKLCILWILKRDVSALNLPSLFSQFYCFDLPDIRGNIIHICIMSQVKNLSFLNNYM